MRIVDVQNHEPSVWLDWEATDEVTQRKLLKELELANMNAVGVSSVVLNPTSLKWAYEAASEMPDKFAICRTVNPKTTHTRGLTMDEFITGLRRDPRVVGIRIVLSKGSGRWIHGAYPPGLPDWSAKITPEPHAHDLTEGIALLDSGGYDEVLTGCERENLPVFLFAPTRADKAGEIAQRWPNLTLILDHLCASQAPVADRDEPPFRSLPELLTLAVYPNVVLKLSGVPALSDEPFPYNDMWDSVLQLVDAFGVERLMWASDISRFNGRLGLHARNPYGESAYGGKHNLGESLRYILDSERLTETQKEWILERSAQKWLGWPAADLFD